MKELSDYMLRTVGSEWVQGLRCKPYRLYTAAQLEYCTPLTFNPLLRSFPVIEKQKYNKAAQQKCVSWITERNKTVTVSGHDETMSDLSVAEICGANTA